MSAEVAVNKDNKKTAYKEYVGFLQHYNKDDHSNGTLKKGYKGYLEEYSNMKYSPVQPPFIQKEKEQKKTVKTEVFVEINNPPNPVRKICKIVPCNGVQKSRDTTDDSSSKVAGFKIEHNGRQEHKKLSIGEISKKFEENGAQSAPPTQVFKPPLKKKNSISNMTKVFEDNSNAASQNERKHVEVKKNIFNNAAQMSKNNPTRSTTVITVPASPTLARHPPPKPASPPFSSPPQIKVIPPSKSSSPAPPESSVPLSPPPPPPPMPPANFSVTTNVAIIPHAQLSQTKTNGCSPQAQFNQPKTNGYNTLPKMHPVPNDGKGVPKLDRNDPMVKKLVNNAYRGMVGGYHEKATDYVNTLPKNRVKKNNGLDSIIQSLGYVVLVTLIAIIYSNY